MSIPSSSASMGPICLSLPFRTLRGALRLAVALVLEYSYKHRGGYKLSPAEKRSFAVAQANGNKSREKNSSNDPNQTTIAQDVGRGEEFKVVSSSGGIWQCFGNWVYK